MDNDKEHRYQDTETQAEPFDWLNRLTRPKGNIEPPVLAFLLTLACIPLVFVLARAVALPGAGLITVLDFEWLHNLGSSLNQTFSLEWIPPADRSTVMYLLLLPTGAVLVALARLTFGLHVLGFRAILIAIGFQEAGVASSLLLLAIVLCTIAIIRPPMRRIRLPVYARVSVILCVTAMIMVCALMVAPLFHSELLWGVAFFPVIIVAMLAEGFAKTLAKDNLVTAIWRTAWTLIVAAIFAVISTRPVVRFSIMQFPELMLTQLICVILISEFLDFRWLERWPNRLNRLIMGEQGWRSDKPVIAVVRNRWNRGVIGRLGRPAPSQYRKRSVQPMVDALRDEGFRAKVMEGDTSLIRGLERLLPPNPSTGAPGGIVLNLSTGLQGAGRFCQIPAILELSGVAYTGPDPVAQANMLDRYVLLTLLREAGLLVPHFALSSATQHTIEKLEFPVAVYRRGEPDGRWTRARNRDGLEEAVEQIRRSSLQPAMLEERVKGREIRVSLIGNETLECLPLLERGQARNTRKSCPAELDDSTADLIRETAFNAFKASGCRDYARIDIRLTDQGEPVVLAVNWDGILARRGSFVCSAEAAGYTYAQVIHKIIDAASARYGTVPDTSIVTSHEPIEFSKWLPGKRVGAQ